MDVLYTPHQAFPVSPAARDLIHMTCNKELSEIGCRVCSEEKKFACPRIGMDIVGVQNLESNLNPPPPITSRHPYVSRMLFL